MIFAVVPAAGRSRRMGRPKLLLRLGERTVLEHVVMALRQGGVDRVLVVIAPTPPELGPIAEAAGASVCQLPHETADMRATVEHGLAWIDKHWQPARDDAWLLAPADHPMTKPDVVRQLCLLFERRESHSIFVPVHDGRRGHPVLFSWNHVAEIRKLSSGLGIDAYVRLQPDVTLEVAVSEASVLCDLNTPEEYEQVRCKWDPGSA